MQKTLGGDRLGAGKKMQIALHNYERSTHDLSYLWRSTMSIGTLVPFMVEIALPGDTMDINLNCEIKTLPTNGPLFGSHKVQLDVFQCPIRLYNSLLHNNRIGIGLNISQVKFPTITLKAAPVQSPLPEDTDNMQINPSCILSYLGLRGIGINDTQFDAFREFNATPILCYWDIYKQYYSNKMEEIGAVIHTPGITVIQTIDNITITPPTGAGATIPQSPSSGGIPAFKGCTFTINYTGQYPNLEAIIIKTTEKGEIRLLSMLLSVTNNATTTTATGPFNPTAYGNLTINSWRYATSADVNTTGKPIVQTFPLTNIDDEKVDLLSFMSTSIPYNINNLFIPPYSYLQTENDGMPAIMNSQEGLGIKTYQSDLFNNWLKTEYIDQINLISAIDTTSGAFTIDTFLLSKKVWNLLNRIAVSGGTYDDWLDAVYTEQRYTRAETPMYMGGLSKELVFQEVISNTTTDLQPLGTLAGRGVMTNKHKGGHVIIKPDEPSYIIGIISITPRVDYSQGNQWHMGLKTLDDLHKPELDQIGFQELITEQMHWGDTHYNDVTQTWEQMSAGKQPAWLNYMTNVNQVRGNFAVPNNQMFMTLNRRYELDPETLHIKDLTTYIDPSKFNFIFAETETDAQNFWAQIAITNTARRKMSAKLMPNI